MKLVPPSSAWIPINAFLTFSTRIVYWICRPFSNLVMLFGSNLIRGLLRISIVNVIGWIGLSTFILHVRSKKKSSPVPK